MRPEDAKLILEWRVVVGEWLTELDSGVAVIDPMDELDWESLLIGFLLGQKVFVGAARDLARIVKYHEGDVRKVLEK